jgi:hypothetical protein
MSDDHDVGHVKVSNALSSVAGFIPSHGVAHPGPVSQHGQIPRHRVGARGVRSDGWWG